MRIIVYMAITANGLIATKDNATDFILESEWEHFAAFIKEIGCMIVGRKTYDVMARNNEFRHFSDVKIVVISKNKKFKVIDRDHVVATSPLEALMFLTRDGCEVAVLAGGGTLNAAFMAENLVDEMYLDVQPAIIGHGINFFAGTDFFHRLELLASNRLPDGQVQLHYRVVK